MRLGLTVDVGREVRVDVAAGRGVRVGLGVALNFGLRVMVGDGVWVGVREGVREGVSVSVFVRVGVLDNAAVSNCASRVPAAWVARALRFSVGEGSWLAVTEAVTVEVLVFEGVPVREAVGETVPDCGVV